MKAFINRIVFLGLVAFTFLGALSANENAFVVRDGVAAYPAMDDKAAPIVTFMRNQKVEVLEKYRGQAGQWSKVRLSKDRIAYIKTEDLSDKPWQPTPLSLVERLKGQSITDMLKRLGPPNQVLEGDTPDVRIYMWQWEKLATSTFFVPGDLLFNPGTFGTTVSKKSWAMFWVRDVGYLTPPGSDKSFLFGAAVRGFAGF